ncbi:MAG: sigma-70 family RNA polymerase sigma factor [Paludibacteraceae bacterium]|nr:sigma-70 family RNA polymerase sigma factor [Paludibacteraceae bacterium]
MKEFDYISEYALDPERATAKLYDLYRYRFISYIQHQFSTLTAEDVEDIYNESILVVWENVGRGKLTSGNIRSSILTYIIGVGSLKAKHLLSERKDTQFVELKDTDYEFGAELVDYGESPVRQAVREILEKLDTRCRNLLDLFYTFGYEMATIAAKLGMPNADTAKAQKYKCMKRFEELYNSTSM